MKQNTYITITRQYGSGGKEISSIVAQKLDLRCYDHKIIALAAAESGLTSNVGDVLDQSYDSPETCLDNSGYCAYERVLEHDRMYIEQAKVILAIAQQGSAVFLGHCADYILKDQPHTYSFFISADDEFRRARSKDHYGNRTLKELDGEDKDRKRYYGHYTGQVWGNSGNYDLTINTSHISLEEAADIIIKYVDFRQAAKASAEA
jgi:cytidylate kinase